MRGLTGRQRLVLVATAAANALVFFDQTSVSVALPAIQRALDATGSEAQWVIGSYLLVLSALMAAGGKLGDVYGRRRVFLVGALTFGVGSLLGAVAPDQGALIGARVVQGVGASLTVPLALANLTAALPAQRRGWAIGALASGGTSALSLGPLLGGALIEVAGWRAIFLVNLPIVALVLVAGTRGLAETRGEDGARVDWPGVALLSGGLSSLVLGLLQLHDWGATSSATLTAFAVGVLALAAFVLVEGRVAKPLIALAMLRKPSLSGALFALMAIQFVVLGVTVYLLLYLQHVLGFGAFTAGLLFLPTVLGSPLLSPLTGRLADRHGARLLVVAGLALAAVSLAWIGALAGRGNVWLLLPAFVGFGVSRPMVFTPASTASVSALPAAVRGVASALTTQARQVGSVLGVAMLGALLTAVEAARRTQLFHGVDASLTSAERAAVDGLLSGGPSGEVLLARLPAAQREFAQSAAADAFTAGFQAAMLASAALVAVAAVVAVVALRPRGR